MGFLRTNYRRTGGTPILAVGGGVHLGSWGGLEVVHGAGIPIGYGGLIGGRLPATEIAVTYWALNPDDAIGSFFGQPASQPGYRIVPFALQMDYFSASIPFHGWFFSCSLSDGSRVDSTAYLWFCGGINSNMGSACSLGFTWWGFICSTP